MAGVEIHLLSSTYYQDPKGFSDKITALFVPDSVACAKLIEAGKCILDFEQNNRRFQSLVRLLICNQMIRFTKLHSGTTAFLIHPCQAMLLFWLLFLIGSESTAETIS